MPTIRGCLLVLVAACALIRAASAQEPADPSFAPNEPAAGVKHGKVLHAFRLTGAAPVIDGRLDDEVWTLAERVEGFSQWDPDNMAPMTERTTLQVAYDSHYLYAAVRCDDRTPSAITRGLGRRDEFQPTDQVSVAFDPRHDHLTGYAFLVNPSGVQTDISLYDDEQTDRDYDAVWEVRTSTTPDGWVAEYRIPFSQMRFTASPQPGQVWGFSSRRTIHRKAEMGEWTGRPRGEQGSVSRWGHLVFDAPLTPPRRIELQPYVLTSGTRHPAAASELRGSTGLDLRLGLGSSATLSATVNPDFGQVEQDPAVLNLTVFETFFPEKRPFFLEDSRTFIPPYGLFQLFHSRRIGGAPARFALPTDATVSHKPDQTTIVGALKLTGKGSGWTYGAMSALTRREYASIVPAGAAALVDRLIEPASTYNVARVQRDVLSGTSNIGAIATGVVRQGDLDAYTGGADYNLRWDRNRANLNGHWVVTHAPIDNVARTGAGGVTNFNVNRKYVGGFMHLDHFGRNFRVDDIGFFRTRPNRTAFEGGWRIEQPDPWKKFRQIGMNVFTGHGWNSDVVFNRVIGTNAWAQFRNFWSVESGYDHAFHTLDDIDTRGGPPIFKPASNGIYFGVVSDNRRNWRLN